MALFDRLHTGSYSSFIATMAVSCNVFEIKRDEETPNFFTALVFNLHDPLEPIRIFARNFNTNCPSP